VLQSRRDFSACTIQNTGAGNGQCGGSATNETGTVFYYVTGTSSVFNLAGDRPGIGPRSNFAPTNYFPRPDQRYKDGLFANLEHVVSLDFYVNEASRHAPVVLPPKPVPQKVTTPAPPGGADVSAGAARAARGGGGR